MFVLSALYGKTTAFLPIFLPDSITTLFVDLCCRSWDWELHPNTEEA